MPDIIKLLPDSVANQIAAGEVIQRPASLIKELVENSVDAGSKVVKIVIKDSGRTLVQVIDDGAGMSETDARLCFERHATSKISSAEDLFLIQTKGFRGEALASITAVAMVELKTRKVGEEIGTLIKINGSKVEMQEPVSCPTGTNIAVKNLFFNVPARRKFLKSEATELRHIINEFQRIAIAHPDISFIFISNEKELFNLNPVNKMQRLMGIFGKNINASLVNINTETSLIRISGFIGKPEHARKTFGEQYFFVNYRYMRHPYFHKAVMEAYENVLQPDSFPSYFIFLEADPATIDVNIHPTKTEIKFENERMIWQIIHASVREAIGKFNISPSIDFDREGLIEIPPPSKDIKGMPEYEIDPGYNPFSEDDKYQRPTISFEAEKRDKLFNWEKLFAGIESTPRSEKGEVGLGQNDSEQSHERLTRLIQIKSKFILCPVKSGLMVIDQRRAHERILFEKFLEALSKGTSVGQKSLFPRSLELSQADIALLSEIEDDLKNVGFDINYLGNNSISINGYPADSGNDDPVQMFEILLEDYKSTRKDISVEPREKLARSMARAGAIPYGKQLSEEEMRDLFDTLFSCKTPNYSATGKPVVNIITIEELDKRLK
ncbi:MAG TPA: DNA mismatch repair endonuclease MutL [Bacteroidales bacterium]|nr:DNA mismatch repair endonuclease MutL [Bacteroidales bacterium]